MLKSTDYLTVTVGAVTWSIQDFACLVLVRRRSADAIKKQQFFVFSIYKFLFGSWIFWSLNCKCLLVAIIICNTRLHCFVFCHLKWFECFIIYDIHFKVVIILLPFFPNLKILLEFSFVCFIFQSGIYLSFTCMILPGNQITKSLASSIAICLLKYIKLFVNLTWECVCVCMGVLSIEIHATHVAHASTILCIINTIWCHMLSWRIQQVFQYVCVWEEGVCV